jgi:hypothetical protein
MPSGVEVTANLSSLPSHIPLNQGHHGSLTKRMAFATCCIQERAKVASCATNIRGSDNRERKITDVSSYQTYTAGIILYRDYLYVNLYQMPILYVEIDIICSSGGSYW